MITFDPYIAKKIGINEAIVYEYSKETMKHAYTHQFGKFWFRLGRFDWIHYLFFLKESEYDQAIENLLKYRILESNEGVYTLNEIICD